MEDTRSVFGRNEERDRKLMRLLEEREIVEASTDRRGVWENPLVLELKDGTRIELSNGEDGDPPLYEIERG